MTKTDSIKEMKSFTYRFLFGENDLVESDLRLREENEKINQDNSSNQGLTIDDDLRFKIENIFASISETQPGYTDRF